jgi:hypothetical protein
LQGLHSIPVQDAVIMTPVVRSGKQLSPATAGAAKIFRCACAGAQARKAAWCVITDVALRGLLPSRDIAARVVRGIIRSLAQLAGNSGRRWALRDRSAVCGMPFPPGHRRGRYLV